MLTKTLKAAVTIATMTAIGASTAFAENVSTQIDLTYVWTAHAG